jgi:SPP1 gp7 family putative phage head morphogenesis protein
MYANDPEMAKRWEEHTPKDKKLPKKRKKSTTANAKQRKPFYKIDPTRSLTLRRAFARDIRKAFSQLKGHVYKLIVTDDAFGLRDRIPPLVPASIVNVFCPTGEGGGVDPTCSPSGYGEEQAGRSTIPEGMKWGDHIRNISSSMSKKEHYHGEIKLIDEMGKEFVRGGVTWREGGHCVLSTGEVTGYTPSFFPIRSADEKEKETSWRGLMAHEMMHGKFEYVTKQYEKEQQAIADYPRPAGQSWRDDIIYASGELKPEHESKFPTYARLWKFREGSEMDYKTGEIKDVSKQLEKDDGVTDYSKSYWGDFKDGKASYHIAIHETLAEIASQKEITGKSVGSKLFKEYYKTVNNEYKILVGAKQRKLKGPTSNIEQDQDKFVDITTYFDKNWKPTTSDRATYIRQWFKDGSHRWGIKSEKKKQLEVVNCGANLNILEVPDIRQPDHYSCGAAAAMSVGRYFEVGPENLDKWKRELGTDIEESTSPKAIVSYLRSLGLDVQEQRKMTIADLFESVSIGSPVIVPIQDYGPYVPDKARFAYGHYLTVIGVGGGYVFCQDSSEDNVIGDSGSAQRPGRVMIAENDFLEAWHDRDIEGNKYIRYGIIVSNPKDEEITENVLIDVPFSNIDGSYSLLTVNTRWKFASDPQKLKSFQQWLKHNIEQTVKSKKQKDDVWDRYIQAGFRKGAGRSFDDVRKARSEAMGEKQPYYEGTKEEFLRSSFAQPIAKEKLELLVSRSFDELEGVTDEMDRRMARELADGLVEGKSPRDIARDVNREVDLGQERALRVARTEIIRAHAEGQLIALEGLGVEELGVQVEWSTAEDEDVCPECEDMEGTIIDIDDAHNMIPLHPNCRCAWVPALPEEITKNKLRIENVRMSYFADCPRDDHGHCLPSGTADIASKSELKEAQNLAIEKGNNVKPPTKEEKKSAAERIARIGVNEYRNEIKGNSVDRRRRRKFLLKEFGNGHTCPCVYCGRRLTDSTLTQDKIYTSREGGRYKHDNLVPACEGCNKARGDTHWENIRWSAKQ